MRNQLNELKPCKIHPGHIADYCITGFMQQMQCNVTPSLVWLSVLNISRTTRPGYTGTTTILQIVLNTYPKNLYLNQATQKNTCQIFLPKNIPGWKISTPPQKNPSIVAVTGNPAYPPWDLLASEKPQHLETRPVY